MFVVLIPVIAEVVITTSVATVAAKAASDLYDRATRN